MTALELNTNIYRSLGVISEDEKVLKRVSKYLERIAKQMTEDTTRMSEEEFYARLEKAEKEPSHRFKSVDELDQFIRDLQ